MKNWKEYWQKTKEWFKDSIKYPKEFVKTLWILLKNNFGAVVREVFITLLTTLVALCAIPFVNNFIGDCIVPLSSSLQKLDEGVFFIIDIIIVILSVLSLGAFFYKSRKDKVWPFPTLLFNLFIFFGILWGYEKYVSVHWEQWGIFHSNLTYSTIAIIILSATLLIHFGFWIDAVWKQTKSRIAKEKQEQENLSTGKEYGYTDDEPITAEDEDILGRKTFAKNIANWIKDIKVEKGACSIAINSPWGYGKTSFLNLVKEKLKDIDDFIIMEFSPWHFSPTSDITKMFFSRLQNECKGLDNRLSDFFAEYSDLLSNTHYSFVQKLFKRSTSYETLMSDISKMLRATNRKLIIIIDDFDRLSASEIQEVLRLIRGSANFPSLIFLTAFDRDYVQTTLRESSDAMSPHYLEKFFEHQYNLPVYSKKVLRDRILVIARKFMEADDLATFTEYLGQDNSLFNKGYVFEPLGNLRGVNRWMNSISVKYNVLRSECVITDLADLELLNMLFPKIYTALEQDKEKYLIAEHGGNYTLWDESKASDDNMRWLHRTHANLKKNTAYTEVEGIAKDNLDEILDRLLPKNSWRSVPKSFRDSNYTDRYLYQDLQAEEMTDNEFIKYISKPLSEIKEDFKNDKNGLYLNTLFLHSKDQKIESKETILNLLHVMYYAMAHYGKFFDSEIVFRHLENLKLSKEKTKELLISLIEENGFSYGLVCCYSTWNSNRYSWEKYLSEEDMNDILKNMIRFAIKEDLPYETIRSAHMRTSIIDRKINDEGKKEEKEVFPLAEIEEMYQKYIVSSLSKIASNFIWFEREGPRPTGKLYVSTDFTRYWQTWSEVESFCNQHGLQIPKDDDKINEFKEFVSQYNANGNNPVEFEFKSIVLSK